MTAFRPLSLKVSGLSAGRNGCIAVAGISFDLVPGEALSITGSNGSGKSSLLRTLAGFSPKLAGHVTWSEGQSTLPNGTVRKSAIHYLGHENGHAARLTVAENLHFWRGQYGVEGPEPRDILPEFGLGSLANRRAGQLSAGQRRRLALARLLVAPRPVWLLDEPDAALDSEGADLLARICDDHRSLGGLLLVAAHGGYQPTGGLQLTLEADA